jgi:hypothetical protein
VIAVWGCEAVRYVVELHYVAEAVPLPLPAIRFLPRLDGAGTAPAGPQTMRLAVQPQKGGKAAQVRSLRVDYSADGGRTWTRAAVRHRPTGWQTSVTPLATPGTWISLRSTVTDRAGGRGSQTILNAHPLRD